MINPTKKNKEKCEIQNKQDASILEQHEDSQDHDQSQYQSSQISSESQVRQRPVFEFIEEQRLIQMRKTKPKKQLNQQQNQQGQAQSEEQNQALHEDQREAFLYLHSVRKEKKTLLQEKKKRKTQSKLQKPLRQKNPQEPIKQKLQSPSIHLHDLHIKTDSIIDQYTKCILQNFNILIQNVKYMIKKNESYSQNNKKFNVKLYESIKLQNEPQIYELIRLTIGEIELAIRKLSLEIRLGPKTKKESLEDEKVVSTEEKSSLLINYSLWIYSLLALHQGWSSYKHFEALAQINFILTSKVQDLDKMNQQEQKTLLILFIIMINVFEQRHLTKHLASLLKKLQ